MAKDSWDIIIYAAFYILAGGEIRVSPVYIYLRMNILIPTIPRMIGSMEAVGL